MPQSIYLDYASATPVDPRVLAVMLPYFNEHFANPSSIYHQGRLAREAIERARDQVALSVGAKPAEIIFASGGTEANNLAIFGVTQANQSQGKHIIISAIEHQAVLQPCRALEKRGWKVSLLKVSDKGIVDVEHLKRLSGEESVLCSVMLANNEIGTIQPLAEIGAILRKKNVYFHTDACQALGLVPINVHDLQVDLLTLNSGKVYGPKGVGALYVARGVKMESQVRGGKQEYSLRAGTENVAGIVGFGEACELAIKSLSKESVRIKKLRDTLLSNILKIPGTRANGDLSLRLVNNINISFEGIEPEALLLYLDQMNVAVSSGSACAQSDMTASHVLLALGVERTLAQASLRITLGRMTTVEEIAKVAEILPKVVEKLRM